MDGGAGRGGFGAGHVQGLLGEHADRGDRPALPRGHDSGHDRRVGRETGEQQREVRRAHAGIRFGVRSIAGIALRPQSGLIGVRPS